MFKSDIYGCGAEAEHYAIIIYGAVMDADDRFPEFPVIILGNLHISYKIWKLANLLSFVIIRLLFMIFLYILEKTF